MVGLFWLLGVASRAEKTRTKKGRSKNAPLEKKIGQLKKKDYSRLNFFKKKVLLNGRTSGNTIEFDSK